MISSDRRIGFRVPSEMFLNQYIADQPYRAMAGNLSETGVLLNRVKAPGRLQESQRVIGLEFELPGTGETIWARGEICYQGRDSYFYTDGVRFTAMPKVHARLLRDYCIESRRQNLGGLLSRIRRTDQTTPVH
jgi:hypothetical protein